MRQRRYASKATFSYRWLENTLRRECDVPLIVRATALKGTGGLAGCMVDSEASYHLSEQSLQLFMEIGDIASAGRRQTLTATQLFGVAQALRDVLDTEVLGYQRSFLKQYPPRTRQLLTEAEWAAA